MDFNRYNLSYCTKYWTFLIRLQLATPYITVHTYYIHTCLYYLWSYINVVVYVQCVQRQTLCTSGVSRDVYPMVQLLVSRVYTTIVTLKYLDVIVLKFCRAICSYTTKWWLTCVRTAALMCYIRRSFVITVTRTATCYLYKVYKFWNSISFEAASSPARLRPLQARARRSHLL